MTTTTTENPTYRLELSSSPHVHSRWNTKQAMWLVVLALIPAIVSAVVFFGFYQLLVIAVAVGFAVGTEAAIKTIRKRKVTINRWKRNYYRFIACINSAA
ncbi:MAG: RnfABCDGE type electron transport complex subunit D [Melioribacteraceae bacterium]|nr:RnfABCDGE type electron transport complex subunit D [Melioribacteraceae bacterium]